MKLIQFINLISLVLSFRAFGMIYLLLLLFISLFGVVDGLQRRSLQFVDAGRELLKVEGKFKSLKSAENEKWTKV